MSKQLSSAMLAAMQNGAQLSAADLQAQTDAILQPLDASADVAETVVTEATVSAPNVDAEALPGIAAVAVVADPALVTYLQTDLAATRLAHTTAVSQLALVTAERDAAVANLVPLMGIARETAGRLCVALNSTPIALETLSASQLSTYWTSVDTEFKKKFKPGAVAQIGAVVDNGTTDVAVPSQTNSVSSAATRAASVNKR